ncbi:MAG: hypothetical protein K8R40_11285 [Anaerolineaceae bacterium]|nr:hypothetical protein [Anaerolineaceae bacterium]
MRLLFLVADGDVHSYATIADQLGVSRDLLEQMMRGLARMECITPVGEACDTSQCHHCPLGGSCATDARGNVWVLTAKGTRAAARKKCCTKSFLDT